MTRNVRNSWVEIDVSSRKNDIGTGPVGPEDTMTAQFMVRDQGYVKNSVRVTTHAEADGVLVLRVVDQYGKLIHEHRTVR